MIGILLTVLLAVVVFCILAALTTHAWSGSSARFSC